MKLTDIAELLSNRINQPHYVESWLRKVFNKGYETGKAVEEQNSISKYMSDKSEYDIERICRHLEHVDSFEMVERGAKLNGDLPIDYSLALIAQRLDNYEEIQKHIILLSNTKP